MSAPGFVSLLAPLSLAAPQVVVTLPASASSAALGRVRIYFSTKCAPSDGPPLSQCSDDQTTSQVFGVDTPSAGLAPGSSVAIDDSILGYPRWKLSDLAKGKYCVQAELFKYERYAWGW